MRGALEMGGNNVNNALNVNATNNVSASNDVVAGRDIGAGRHLTASQNITAGGLISGSALSIGTGGPDITLDAEGNMEVDGGILLPTDPPSDSHVPNWGYIKARMSSVEVHDQDTVTTDRPNAVLINDPAYTGTEYKLGTSVIGIGQLVQLKDSDGVTWYIPGKKSTGPYCACTCTCQCQCTCTCTCTCDGQGCGGKSI
jgi:hypothetical protein